MLHICSGCKNWVWFEVGATSKIVVVIKPWKELFLSEQVNTPRIAYELVIVLYILTSKVNFKLT